MIDIEIDRSDYMAYIRRQNENNLSNASSDAE